MKRIRAFDYLRQYNDIEDKVLSGIKTVLNSGNLILGEQVKRFENNFSILKIIPMQILSFDFLLTRYFKPI